MTQVYKLKSTGQELQPLRWTGITVQPWPPEYRRMMLFIGDVCHVQIIHKSNIRIEKA